MHLGQTDGIYRGGCCDNDVHEHIKCMEEAGLNAYVHETASGDFVAYNCVFEANRVQPKSRYLQKLYFYTLSPRSVALFDRSYEMKSGMNVFEIVYPAQESVRK